MGFSASAGESPLFNAAVGVIMATYQLGTQVQLTVTFTDAAGALVDPTTVNLFMQKPGDTVQTYTYPAPGTVTRLSLGVFAYTITTDTVGRWFYAWQGLGAVVVSTPDLVFDVQPSNLR